MLAWPISLAMSYALKPASPNLVP